MCFAYVCRGKNFKRKGKSNLQENKKKKIEFHQERTTTGFLLSFFFLHTLSYSLPSLPLYFLGVLTTTERNPFLHETFLLIRTKI